MELAEYIVRDIEIALNSNIDVGLEDNSEDDKKDDKNKSNIKNMSFAKRLAIVIQIIIRLLKVALRVIGIVGVSVIGIIRGRITAFVDVGEKMLDKIETTMKENNISDKECPKGREEDPGYDFLTAYFYKETGNYKSAVMKTLEEIKYFRQYEKIIVNMNKAIDNLDIENDFQKLSMVNATNGKLPEEAMVIVRKYYQDLPLALAISDPSPLTKSIGKSAEFKTFFSKFHAKDMISIMPSGGGAGKKTITFDFQGLLERNSCDDVLSSLTDPSKRSNTSRCYEFISGTVEIPYNKGIDTPILSLKDLRDIVNGVKEMAKEGDSMGDKLNKVHKTLKKKMDDIDKLRDNYKHMGNNSLVFSVLNTISVSVKSYMEGIRAITRYAGRDLSKEIPISILVSNILVKAECVGAVDIGLLKKELEAELKKIEKKYNIK